VCSLPTDDKLNLFTVTHLSVQPLQDCGLSCSFRGPALPSIFYSTSGFASCLGSIKSRTSVPPRLALQPSSPLPHFHFNHVNPPAPLRSMLTSSHWRRLLLCVRCLQTARRSSTSPPSIVSIPPGAASVQVNVPLQRSRSRSTLMAFCPVASEGVDSPMRRSEK